MALSLLPFSYLLSDLFYVCYWPAHRRPFCMLHRVLYVYTASPDAVGSVIVLLDLNADRSGSRVPGQGSSGPCVHSWSRT